MMKPLLPILFLALAGQVLAGEVQWGDTTNYKSKEDSAYQTKDYQTKEFSPDSFSRNSLTGSFDRAYNTGNKSLFDKDFGLFNKDYKTADLDFDRIYGTKEANYTSKTSPLGDQTSLFKTTDNRWSGQPFLSSYDKSLPNKEYTGREGKVVAQDMEAAYKSLNKLKDLPDRDLTVDEVRSLVNKGKLPDAKASASPGSAAPQVSPPSSLSAPQATATLPEPK